MKTSLSMNKIASILSTLTACATLALGSTGCLFSGSIGTPDTRGDITDPDTVVITTPADPTIKDPVGPDPVVTVPEIAEIAIDTGATMSAAAGEGVGVFVQYDEGGFWTLYTTCDTAISGTPCKFDILAYAVDQKTVIGNVEGIDLAIDDTFALNDDGSINLVTETSFEMTGFTFDAEPGATIELDVMLDGEAAPQFVYLVSDGSLIEGVPTNPIDIYPSTP